MNQLAALIRCGLCVTLGGALGEVLGGPQWAALSGMLTPLLLKPAIRLYRWLRR